jgi:hypothetical protein
MIEYRTGNLLEQEDVDVIIHGANLHSTMGAGLALQIKNKYPEAALADREFKNKELGTFSFAKCADGKIVVNLYGQEGIGNDGEPLNRNARYDAIFDALFKLKKAIEARSPERKKLRLGIPKNLGCGLAGGAWRIVNAIIEEVFLDSEIEVSIVEYVPN